MRGGFLEGFRVRRGVDFPVLPDGEALGGQLRAARRRYLADVPEYAAAHALRRSDQHYVRNAVPVDHRTNLRVLQQRLYLAGKHDSIGSKAIKKRFHTYPVPGEEQSAAAAVPYRKCKDSVEHLHAAAAVLHIAAQDYLRVRVPGELHSAPLKLPAKFCGIIQLPVIDQRESIEAHRLRTVVRVDYRQATVDKIRVAVNVKP